MIFTYSNQRCLYDENQRAQDFLDRNQSLGNLTDQVWANASINSRDGPRDDRLHVGMPKPNYSEYPEIKINQLIWPTGAARWARGYFLFDTPGKDEIESVTSCGSTAAELHVETPETGIFLKAALFPLAPVKISSAGDPALWLIPLVDERFWWQFKSHTDTDYDLTNTWTNAYQELATQLGIVINADGVPAAYKSPDPGEFSRYSDNPAVILDAVAHSVGHRIIRDFDGTVYAYGWANSKLRVTSSIDDADNTPWWRIAGGQVDLKRSAETVRVQFPKAKSKFPDCGEAYSLNNLCGGSCEKSGSVKVYHSTCLANYEDGVLQNSAILSALASQITTDYCDSQAHSYDHTFVGLKKWELNGYDDFVLFNFGVEYPTGHLEAVTETDQSVQGGEPAIQDYSSVVEQKFEKLFFTRIRSVPENFGVEQQWSQSEKVRKLAGAMRFKVKTGDYLLPKSSTTAFVVEWDTASADWVTTTEELKVWDPFGRAMLCEGEEAQAFLFCDSCRFEIVQEVGLYRRGKAVGDIACDATGTVKLNSDPSLLPTGSCTADGPCPNVTVCNDWTCSRNIKNNEEVFIRWLPEDSKWHIARDPRNRWMLATAGSNFDCKTSSLSMTPTEALDCCDPDIALITTVANTLGNEGCAGDVMLVRHKNSDNTWFIVKVIQKEIELLKSLRMQGKIIEGSTDPDGNDGDCFCEMQGLFQKFCMESCGDPEWRDLIKYCYVEVLTDWWIDTIGQKVMGATLEIPYPCACPTCPDTTSDPFSGPGHTPPSGPDPEGSVSGSIPTKPPDDEVELGDLTECDCVHTDACDTIASGSAEACACVLAFKTAGCEDTREFTACVGTCGPLTMTKIKDNPVRYSGILSVNACDIGLAMESNEDGTVTIWLWDADGKTVSQTPEPSNATVVTPSTTDPFYLTVCLDHSNLEAACLAECDIDASGSGADDCGDKVRIYIADPGTSLPCAEGGSGDCPGCPPTNDPLYFKFTSTGHADECPEGTDGIYYQLDYDADAGAGWCDADTHPGWVGTIPFGTTGNNAVIVISCGEAGNPWELFMLIGTWQICGEPELFANNGRCGLNGEWIFEDVIGSGENQGACPSMDITDDLVISFQITNVNPN